jgi:Rhomboid family
LRPTYSDPDLEYRFLCIPARRPTRTVAGSRRGLSAACSAADIKLARSARARLLLVLFGVNLLFGLGSISMAGVEQAIAWQAHIGGFLAGLLAFAAFDPIPISTGGGPNGGMDAPPPSDQS